MFKKPKYGKYYVAVANGNFSEISELKDLKGIIGMMMIHHEMKPQVGGLVHWINSVYVHPQFRKRGVFRALYNHIFNLAKADPMVKCVRLYVDTTNGKAMDVYTKMGMHNIEDDFDFNETDFHF